ncbi:hypothetical protein EZS27_038492, partial [termite gut metagenome]
ATVSKETFFDAIVNERALEFTGEMLRKGDLIRWNLLGAKLQEAKAKLEQLENRAGKYNLPNKIYYKANVNGETVDIYGLNIGETDTEGESLGYESNKSWKLSADDDKTTYWDALYLRDPDTQQFWPIWQVFLDTSNGMLNNDAYNTPSN